MFTVNNANRQSGGGGVPFKSQQTLTLQYKVSESLVYRVSINEHTERHNLGSESQHGFSKEKSGLLIGFVFLEDVICMSDEG